MPKDPPVKGSLRRMDSSAQKKYKVNLKSRSRVDLPKEQEILEDTIVVLKVAHYSNMQIAKIVGLSRGQVAEILKSPNVERRVATLGAKLPQAALNQIQNFMIEAVMWIIHVGRANLGPDGDHSLVLRAADQLLDRGGTPKVSRNERKEESQGMLDHIGRGGHEDVFSEIGNLSPELQERAAQLYDALEDGLKHIVAEAKGEDVSKS